MNTYYSYLGRLLDGRTPFDREGYYVLYEDDSAGYSVDKPGRAEIVRAADFVQALTEGCKTAIRTFAASADNKQVYALNLDANGHGDFYLYLNTVERFERTLSRYQSKYPDYNQAEKIQSLKYGQGDWDFQWWSEHMGEYGRVVGSLEKLINRAQDLNEQDSDKHDAEPVIAFEAGIVKAGYQVLAMQAVMRLIAEQALDALDRTDDFIAFASTENDYVDYSIVMRRTIDPALFERVFPDLKELDRQFEESMEQIRHLSVSKALDYWSDAIHSGGYGSETPFKYVKSEYEVFRRLEHYGSALAEECLVRLLELASRDSLELKDYKEVYFYAEALHFSGALTRECAEQCRTIAASMREKFDDVEEIAQQLLAIGRYPAIAD